MTQKVVYKYDAAGSYTLSAAASVLTVVRNSTTTLSVHLDPVGEWKDPVELSVAGLPQGVLATSDPLSCSPQCSTIVTIVADASTTPGIYPVTIKGTPLGQKAKFSLIVTGR